MPPPRRRPPRAPPPAHSALATGEEDSAALGLETFAFLNSERALGRATTTGAAPGAGRPPSAAGVLATIRRESAALKALNTAVGRRLDGWVLGGETPAAAEQDVQPAAEIAAPGVEGEPATVAGGTGAQRTVAEGPPPATGPTPTVGGSVPEQQAGSAGGGGGREMLPQPWAAVPLVATPESFAAQRRGLEATMAVWHGATERDLRPDNGIDRGPAPGQWGVVRANRGWRWGDPVDALDWLGVARHGSWRTPGPEIPTVESVRQQLDRARHAVLAATYG